MGIYYKYNSPLYYIGLGAKSTGAGEGARHKE